MINREAPKHFSELPLQDWGDPGTVTGPRLVDVLYGAIGRRIEEVKAGNDPSVIPCWGQEMLEQTGVDLGSQNIHPEGDGIMYRHKSDSGIAEIKEFYADSCVVGGVDVTIEGPLTTEGLVTQDHFMIRKSKRPFISLENHVTGEDRDVYDAGVVEVGRVYDAESPYADAERLTSLLKALGS